MPAAVQGSGVSSEKLGKDGRGAGLRDPSGGGREGETAAVRLERRVESLIHWRMWINLQLCLFRWLVCLGGF